MLFNFVIVALRNIKRRATYSLINIFGLALGLAASYVIGTWVWQELSYDKHFNNSEEIYRVSVSFFNSGAFASGPEILASTLVEQAPEVELVSSLGTGQMVSLKVNNQTFEERPFYADSTFFDMFSYEFLMGDPEKVLAHTSSLVITETLAKRYFGGIQNAFGKTVQVGEDKREFLVDGIVKDAENQPSHIPSRLWLPLEIEGKTNWTGASNHTYIKVTNGVTEQQVLSRLNTIKQQLVYPTFNTSTPYEEWKNLNYFDFHLIALEEIHLSEDMRFEFKVGGNRSNVNVFLAISIFLILIAAINFINLSTAQSIRRAKEVGLRKVMGAVRNNLIIQYLSESLTLSAIAMVLGIALAELFLILFQTFTNEQLINGIFQAPYQIGVYVLFSLIIGLLAGVYPAFYLSHFNPSAVFKKGVEGGQRTSSFRNVLVILQFSISIALIISSILVYQQLHHLRNVDIGLVREDVINIENINAIGENKNAFRQDLLARSEVHSVSLNKRLPAGKSVWVYSFKSDQMDQAKAFQTFLADDQFLPTMGMRLIDGRNFSDDIASDSSAVILNQSAVKEMLLEEPIGAQLENGSIVVGVVEDFSYQSYYEKAGPVVLVYDTEGYKMSIKINSSQTADFISYLESEWNQFQPEDPIQYSFLDASFEQLMDQEKTLGKTVGFFTVIAILVSCLGLFGLAAYTASQRKREIGVRKVLGAAVSDIIMLLNKGYSKLISISILIAVPLAYYFINIWLQNFEFKMDIEFWVFIASGLIALFIAWTTVGFLSFKAASANPVDTLAEE